MWNDLLFTTNTVAPLLAMMLVGYLARCCKLIGDGGVKQANSCVFYIFLPILLCFNIMDTPLDAAIDSQTLLFGLIASVTIFLLLFATVRFFCPPIRTRGVMIQAVGRSTYALFGIPLVLSMYPNADTSIASLMVIAVVPVFNIASTVALMLYSDQKASVGKMLRGVLLNPIILGTVIGFALWRLNVQLPTIIESPLRKLGGIATPLALFLLGASLDFRKVRANAKLLTIGVIGRLLIVPALTLPLAVALGVRDVSLAALIAAFASPATVSGYAMAQQMGGDADYTAAHVALTTAFSCLSVFFWVFLFKSTGCLG